MRSLPWTFRLAFISIVKSLFRSFSSATFRVFSTLLALLIRAEAISLFLAGLFIVFSHTAPFV